MAVLLQRGDFLRCRKLCSTFVIPVSHLHQGGCSAILAVNYDVGVKRYFAPSDTELLRALHSRNSKNIRNPLIFLQKMASYSCFWRVPSSKILLQASLRRISDLLPLVSQSIEYRNYFTMFSFSLQHHIQKFCQGHHRIAGLLKGIGLGSHLHQC